MSFKICEKFVGTQTWAEGQEEYKFLNFGNRPSGKEKFNAIMWCV